MCVGVFRYIVGCSRCFGIVCVCARVSLLLGVITVCCFCFLCDPLFHVSKTNGCVRPLLSLCSSLLCVFMGCLGCVCVCWYGCVFALCCSLFACVCECVLLVA